MSQGSRDDYSVQELGERFALLSEQAIEYALFLVGTDGNIRTWNVGAERLFGYYAAEIIGRKYDELFAVADGRSQDVAQELSDAFEQGKSTSESLHRRKNGTEFQGKTTATAILDENEEVHTYAVVVRDNTTSEKATMQASRVSELIAYYEGTQSFFSMLAHELQSPLFPIVTAIEVLRRAERSQSSSLDVADLLQRQVNILRCMVDDLLDISRITTAKFKIFPEPRDLNRVVSSACKLSQANFDNVSQSLTLALSPVPVWVNLDRKRIQQVLLNLLSNASKFTASGGKIEVAVGTEGAQAVVRVTDNGIGLKQSMIPHIFDLFPLAADESVKTRGGLGLGLAISRSIAELHDGSLTATSHGLTFNAADSSIGSQFCLRLPLCAEPSNPIQGFEEPLDDTPSADLAGLAVVGPVRVLVISDHIDFAKALNEMLELSGCQSQWSSTGEDAIARSVKFSPQVIMLDMELKVANPYELAQQIDNAGTLQSRIIISLTNGPPSESEIVRGLNSRFNSFLEKPIDFERLKKLLNSAWHSNQPAV